MNTPENEELPITSQAALNAPQKPREKVPKVDQNLAKADRKDSVSAREIRKTAKILGVRKRSGGATITLHLTWPM